jgi:hypothetical protein
MIDIPDIASAAIAAISPLLPYLAKAGTIAAKGFADAIGKAGGAAAWKAAEDVWKRITDARGDDAKLGSAIDLLSADPADADSLATLCKTLEARLGRDPAFRDALVEALGGEQRTQEMIARQRSRISGSEQQLEGEGHQVIEAHDESVVENSRQTIRG